MTRDRLLLTVELVAGAFGVAAMLGILYALMRGSDYPAIVVPAACIYLAFHPLLKWRRGRLAEARKEAK